MANYMVHTCKSRQWYVDEFLIPSLLEQGADDRDIEVVCDTEEKGTLQMYVTSFEKCGVEPYGTWHLQDDIILCRDFVERTEALDNGLVCGLCTTYDKNKDQCGDVRAKDMWYSFPCIRIPNYIAGQFAKWFYDVAVKDKQFRVYIGTRKHEDFLFKQFVQDYFPDVPAINVKPNLIDHIDFLIGGSLVNKTRKEEQVRSLYWEDEQLVDQLVDRLFDRLQPEEVYRHAENTAPTK